MMSISLEEAKSMMTKESLDNLKGFVSNKPIINMGNKMNNDILMQALCRAVSNNVIHLSSLNEKIIKLLNASTNTLSQTKLGDILGYVRKHQPKLVCVISLMDRDMTNIMKEWVFEGPIVKFNNIFEFVVSEFDITPTLVRSKMTEMLKPTIVNNIAQLVAKYDTIDDEEKRKVNISITTIARLVNMMNHLLFAEFKELP
jgi:hypothetical protein